MPGGPKTAAGKAVAKLNHLAHGLRTVLPVVPGLEREDDWRAYHDGIVESYAPEGDLETELARRVALLLWRLRRVIRFETLSIAHAQEHVADDYAGERALGTGFFRLLAVTHPDTALEAARSRERLTRLLERLPAFQNDENVVATDAWDVLSAFERFGRERKRDLCLVDLTAAHLPGGVDPFRHVHWTAGLLRAVLAELARFLATDPTDLHGWVVDRVRHDATQHRALAERAAREVERRRAGRLIPVESDLNKVVRYETHLHRQLLQTMHELEALQARRRGQPAPLARIDLAGLPEE